MKQEYSISRIERSLIISFGFLVFALFATGIFAEAVQSYNESVVRHQNELAERAGARIISFSGGGAMPTIPLFHLITFPIFLMLFNARKFIVSISLTTVYLVWLLISVWVRLDGEGLFGSIESFTDPWLELWMKTSHLDYLAAVVVVVLLPWQASILWRIYRTRGGTAGLK